MALHWPSTAPTLHTNAVENVIKIHFTCRKISNGTRSDSGRACRGAFLGHMKTCARHGISFRDYIGDRLGISGVPSIP